MSGYIFPVSGYNAPINTHWGSVLGGSDLMSPRGTPVLNMQAGKVLESGWDNVGGWSVLVQGDDGNKYYYAHFDKASPVAVGQRIPEGTYLGPVGNTGDAINGPPHLHIGIGPEIKLGNDKYGGTGGDYDAVSLLKQAFGGGAATTVGQQSQAQLNYNDKQSVINYIRQAAQARGIDPDIAVAVANSEGLNVYTGDSNSSFGPFQLHYGNVAGGGNATPGLGDTFTKLTGMDARNPATLAAQIDFSLDQAATGGWGPWHGAQKLGIGNFSGIGSNAKPLGVYSPQGQNTTSTGQQSQGPQRPPGIPDWVPQSMWNMYSSSPYATPRNNPGSAPIPSLSGFSGSPYGAFTPPNPSAPQSSYRGIPGAQIMPYTPGSSPSISQSMQDWIASERNYFQTPHDPWSNMTPLSTQLPDNSQFSLYNAPNAQPDLMSRMARPWSIYG